MIQQRTTLPLPLLYSLPVGVLEPYGTLAVEFNRLMNLQEESNNSYFSPFAWGLVPQKVAVLNPEQRNDFLGNLRKFSRNFFPTFYTPLLTLHHSPMEGRGGKIVEAMPLSSHVEQDFQTFSAALDRVYAEYPNDAVIGALMPVEAVPLVSGSAFALSAVSFEVSSREDGIFIQARHGLSDLTDFVGHNENIQMVFDRNSSLFQGASIFNLHRIVSSRDGGVAIAFDHYRQRTIRYASQKGLLETASLNDFAVQSWLTMGNTHLYEWMLDAKKISSVQSITPFHSAPEAYQLIAAIADLERYLGPVRVHGYFPHAEAHKPFIFGFETLSEASSPSGIWAWILRRK